MKLFLSLSNASWKYRFNQNVVCCILYNDFKMLLVLYVPKLMVDLVPTKPCFYDRMGRAQYLETEPKISLTYVHCFLTAYDAHHKYFFNF